MHFDEKIGTLSFTDLKSLNGTLLNGQPAESGEIKDGDQLQLGNTLFDCQLRPDEWEASISISVRPPEPSAPPAGEVSISKVGSEPEPQRASARSTRCHRIPPSAPAMTRNRKFDEEEPHQTRQVPSALHENTKAGLLGHLDRRTCSVYSLGPAQQGARRSPRVGTAAGARLKHWRNKDSPTEAFAMAEELQKANPEDQQLQMKAAEYFERQGRYDSAITSYTLAAHGKNPVPVATVKLISLLLRFGKNRNCTGRIGNARWFFKERPLLQRTSSPIRAIIYRKQTTKTLTGKSTHSRQGTAKRIRSRHGYWLQASKHKCSFKESATKKPWL
jgi:hypothetical protein